MARKGISPPAIALVIAGILAASIFIYFQIFRGMTSDEEPAPPEPAPVASPPPPAPGQEQPEIEVPPLDASDEVVRSLAETLSSHPRLAAWVAPENLVRRFVAAVVDVANDESPRPHLAHLEPAGDFRVSEHEGDLYIDDASYRRYDRLVEVFTSLDTAAGVRLYRSLEPLFDQAYRELGYPSGDFDQPLKRAIDRVLAVQVPGDEVEVERRVANYRFADPELEALSPVEKHLLRMGSENARALQRKLRVVRTALSLEE